MSIDFLTLRHALIRPAIIREQKEHKAHAGQFSLNVGLLLTFLLVSILYLVQVNTLATKGYSIKELEKKIANQKKEEKRLQMKSIEAGSLAIVQEKSARLQLIPSSHVEYLTPSAVAVK